MKATPANDQHHLSENCRIVVENAIECIWTYDIKSEKFTFVSPAVQRLMGYTVNEAMQKSLAEILPQDSLDKANNTIQLLLGHYLHGERQEDMLTHCGDYELLCKDKTTKQVEITAKFIYDEKSDTFELLGITRDITRRKQLEARLNQALETKDEMICRLRDSEKASKKLAEELHQKNKLLHSHATRDKLTGVCNRYSFDQKVIEETDRCRRYQYPLSAMLFDIDYFKRVNDTFGHHIGDSVLVSIADTVSKNIRIHDTLARWGGEEFLVLMPQTNLSQAAKVAEKLRLKIEAIKHTDVNRPVTASFGVVEFMHGESEESWFKRVDYALFRSKNNGRNQVTAINWDTAIPFIQIKMEWKPEWECGNPVIDNQHKQLVMLGNKLLDAAFADIKSESTAEAMEELIAHIQLHFDNEEEILRQYAYPNVNEHEAVHHALLQQTEKLKQQYQEGNLTSTVIFSFLLDDVVMGHLLKEDIRYFSHLKESGCATADHTETT